ncbi:MAG: hypothetical protein FJ110_08275 [Deltaproteobacteria bacterium]|nr:hypothetical protein [Deltaproteobacteria bacterium]
MPRDTRKNSLLKLINDLGGKGQHSDFYKKIRDYWELTEEEKRNEKKLFHHVAGIEQALKTSELIELQGGVWRITEKGKEHLSSMGYKPPIRNIVSQTLSITGDLPLCKQLLESQRISDNSTMFEKTIAEAFNSLGLPAKHIGGRDEPDILIEDYKVILDGKSTREGIITSEPAIGFERLERYKDKYSASYIGVVGPGFSEGYVRETAKKRGIVLIETEAICRILQNHSVYPYEPNHIVEILFDSGKVVITPKDILPSTINQEKLIGIVAKILSDLKLTRKTSFSSQGLHNAYSWQSLNYESDEIENALKFLSVAPFSILQKQNDEYTLTGDIDSLLKKIGLLLQAFNKIGR